MQRAPAAVEKASLFSKFANLNFFENKVPETGLLYFTGILYTC